MKTAQCQLNKGFTYIKSYHLRSNFRSTVSWKLHWDSWLVSLYLIQSLQGIQMQMWLQSLFLMSHHQVFSMSDSILRFCQQSKSLSLLMVSSERCYVTRDKEIMFQVYQILSMVDKSYCKYCIIHLWWDQQRYYIRPVTHSVSFL